MSGAGTLYGRRRRYGQPPKSQWRGPVYDGPTHYVDGTWDAEPDMYIPSRVVPTKVEAGDLLPTFVTGGDAVAYLGEVDASWSSLGASVRASSAPDSFKNAFDREFSQWSAFYTAAKDRASFFNAKATMDQTDRWADKAKAWGASLQGQQSIPLPAGGGQGIPTPTTGLSSILSGSTGLLAAGAVLAAVLVLGPKFK